MKTVSNSYSAFVGTAPGNVGCAAKYNGGNRSNCHNNYVSPGGATHNCVCTITTTSSYCEMYNQNCSVCGCDSWGAWTGYVNKSCSSSASVNCRGPVKYYK